MWKSFLKQNKKHINLNELYLLVFNELENKDKKNEILEHLQNCYDCNSKYVKSKNEINFLLNNSKFLN
jgi:predicted RNA-binding protein with EMAP domain